MTYAEQATFTGRWTPVTFDRAPTVDERGREKRSDGVGKRIRPQSICEVHQDHEGFDLNTLREFYSLDGRFKASTQAKP